MLSVLCMPLLTVSLLTWSRAAADFAGGHCVHHSASCRRGLSPPSCLADPLLPSLVCPACSTQATGASNYFLDVQGLPGSDAPAARIWLLDSMNRFCPPLMFGW